MKYRFWKSLIILNVTLSLLIGAGDWYLYKRTIAIKKEIETIEQKAKERIVIEQKIKELENKILQNEKLQSNLNKMIPFREDFPFNFIRDISAYCQKYNFRDVKFSLGKLEDTENYEFSFQGKDKKLMQRQIKIQFKGLFEQILPFLEQLVKNPRIVEVKNIAINRDETIIPYQEVELVISIYSMEEKISTNGQKNQFSPANQLTPSAQVY